MDAQKIQRGVRLILEGMGEDPDREGLQGTPDRVARACSELLGGYQLDPAKVFSATFEASHHDIVIVRDMPFYSMCEHHLLPFFGVAHVAYVPAEDGRVCGISKLARALDVYARRLQLQERLTDQLARSIEENLGASGVLVVVEAEHMCMEMRGVSKKGALTVTSTARGLFVSDSKLADRAFALLGKG